MADAQGLLFSYTDQLPAHVSTQHGAFQLKGDQGTDHGLCSNQSLFAIIPSQKVHHSATHPKWYTFVIVLHLPQATIVPSLLALL